MRNRTLCNSKPATSHLLYQTGETGIPDAIKDRNGQVVLALCKRCGKAEAELSGPCKPDEKVNHESP